MHIVKNPEESSEKVKTQLSFYLDNNKSMNHNARMNLKLYSLTFLQLTTMFIVPFCFSRPSTTRAFRSST